MPKPIVGIVVPCYNEEEIFIDSNEKLKSLVENMISSDLISDKSFISYVDDGSKDRTWEYIDKASTADQMVKGLKLSRNCGHQNAVLSGLLSFNDDADCLISIDADLQDDIDVIPEMIQKFLNGNMIVYGVRKKRSTDSFFKKMTALGFYSLMKNMGVDIVYNHADFRLSSQQVNRDLGSFEEVNLFLRGVFPLIGYKSTCVYYDRKERLAGETKYPLKKMLAFAFDGISSFSIKPLRLVTTIGFLVFLLSIGMGIYSLVSFFYLGTVPGWTSIALPIYFLSGIQLLSIGILGEYLGKIYKEVKKRPRFIVEKINQ